MEKEAYECGWEMRQEAGEVEEATIRQQLLHLFYFYEAWQGGKKGVKRALRCSTWYIVKFNFEISRKTFL